MASAPWPVCSSKDGGRGGKQIKLFGEGDGEPQLQEGEQMLLELRGEIRARGEGQPHQLQQQGGGGDHNLQHDHYSQPQGAAYCTATHAFLSSQDAVDRKSANRWTVEEHRGFLRGLEEKGKGKWEVISKEFVKTRTRMQVASHAQKYFLREANTRRRRRSILDVPLEAVSKPGQNALPAPVPATQPSLPPRSLFSAINQTA